MGIHNPHAPTIRIDDVEDDEPTGLLDDSVFEEELPPGKDILIAKPIVFFCISMCVMFNRKRRYRNTRRMEHVFIHFI